MLTRYFLLAGLAAIAVFARQAPETSPPKPMAVVPTPAQLGWHRMEFYGFIHFTQNTFTDREWGQGDENPSQFNPTELDCNQWARVAKEAGMRGLILTAKHHDGFCLWPSQYTEHSVKNSPWRGGKGDVVRELSEACKKQGLAFGVYLSPWDCNHKDYGRPEYVKYYRNQLTELLTHYGPIFEVWFDGANGGRGYYGGARETRQIDRKTYYEWPTTIDMVRKLAPKAMIFSDAGPDIRWVGNESGQASSTTWQTIDTEGTFPGLADEKKLGVGDIGGKHWVPPETDVSIRPGWFHHASEDSKVKTSEDLVNIYFNSVGRGSNLLLNLPPDWRGLLHENDVKSLQGMRKALDTIFAKNLVLGKAPTSSSVRGGDEPRFGAGRAVDSDVQTYWTMDDGALNGTLTVELGGAVEVGVVRVQEAIALGQRVKHFTIDALVDGQWKLLTEGETIGPQRLFRVPPVKATSLRLRITNALAVPCIAEFAAY